MKRKNFSGIKVFIPLLILITAISFSPLWDNGFIDFDDSKLIVENEIINGKIAGLPFKEAFKKHLWTPYYKPLVFCTWIIEHKLFGMNPRVFHINNLLIHILNSILVFIIINLLMKRISPTNKSSLLISFFTALMFAVHPFKVESVAWAVERKDVLFSLFYFLGILSYLKYLLNRKTQWIWLAVLCYFLSCMAKSHGITFIAILFLFDYLWQREWNKNIFIEKWPILLTFLSILIFYGFIGGGSTDILARSNVNYFKEDTLIYDPSNIASLPKLYKVFLLLNFRFWLFLGHLFIPVKMALVYPSFKIINAVGWAIHLFPLMSLGLLYSMVRLYKKNPVLVFGILFFAIALSPILFVSGRGSNFLSDRYTYLSSFSMLFVISYFIVQKLNLRKAILAMAIIILFCSISTFLRTTKWKNDILIWEDNLAKYGEDIFPLNSLGLYYAKELKDPVKALEYLNRSLAFSPDNVEALLYRGNVYGMLSEMDKSILDFQKVVEKNPKHIEAINGLAIGYAQTGKKDLALKNLIKATEIEPENITLLQNLGETYYYEGKYTQAKNIFEKAMRLDNTIAKTGYYLALSYFNLRDYSNANKHIDSVIVLNPTSDHYLLKSKILFYRGNKEEAVSIARNLLSQGFPIDNAYRNLLGI